MSGKLVVGDCIEAMAQLPAECADLIFADPPFNIGYEYDIYDDRRSRDEYLAWAEEWLRAAIRLLKPTGSFWLAMGDAYVSEYKIRLDALGLTMRNWIVWHYSYSRWCEKKFALSHAHILFYVRDPKQYVFNADAVRIPSARQFVYRHPRAKLCGRVPDDTWILRPQETTEHFRPEHDVWFAPRISGTFLERVAHPCQMPEAILERIIRVATNPGDLVVDPFAGSGTTLVVANRLGRRFWGCELSPNYARVIVERLRGLFADEIEVEYLRPQREVTAPAAKPS
jgi:site-specific DNA-methyltransferase (adenine-specific)